MMMRYILAILLAAFSSLTWAEGSKYENFVLSKAPIDRTDLESIRRGAKAFASNCMSCHTLKYLKYNKLAEEEGVTLDKMPFNIKQWPNGITPPDLSLEADYRGIDWIYTYLHSFYKDPSRPTGVNNLLVHNSGMSAILAPFQGEMKLLKDAESNVGAIYNHVEWYNLLEQVKPGTMTPAEFDQLTGDLTNFLAYAAQPYYIEQVTIGKWVLAFLVFFTILMYMLKNEYWKDVKRKR